VHGNLPALEAVLAEVERDAPDVVLVGGDVSAGPFPVECLELLRSLGDRAVWIRGNADREIHGWPAEQLSDEQRAFLHGLAQTLVLEVDDLGEVLFCHGSPRSDEEIITERSPDARLEAALADAVQEVVVHGHTG
jgi:predicted phosphodiesterase